MRFDKELLERATELARVEHVDRSTASKNDGLRSLINPVLYREILKRAEEIEPKDKITRYRYIL